MTRHERLLGVLVGVAGLAVLALAALVTSGVPRTAAGMAAHSLCSVVFLAERTRAR